MEAFINAYITLNMIEKIPHCMVNLLIVSSRLFHGPFRYIPSCSALSPRCSMHIEHKRFYAHPTPGDPKLPVVKAERRAPHDAPDLVFEYDAFDRPIILERHRTTHSPTKRPISPFIYGTIFFLFGAAAGNTSDMSSLHRRHHLPSNKTGNFLTKYVHKFVSNLRPMKW
jgi:hypothetical protein